MTNPIRTSVVARLAPLIVAVLIATSSGSASAAAPRVNGTTAELLAALTTAAEHPAGYARTKFVLWIDADGDGCSTRLEVLIAEAQGTPQVRAPCSVSGSWRSAYDGVVTTNPGSFDIDHTVPLKEAWDSGAWAWTPARRRAFANDLDDWRSLRAVTASSNRSKGDKDPAQWLPPRVAFRCVYANQWIAVKTRWSLKVDSAERSALRQLLELCPTRTASVAVIPFEPPPPTPTPTPDASPSTTPSATPSPTPTPGASPSPSPTPTP